VIAITVGRLTAGHNKMGAEAMPILMLALIALAAFGLIGIFLFAASHAERHQADKVPGTKPAPPVQHG
jgi:flagellar basal body-associated protein FliL